MPRIPQTNLRSGVNLSRANVNASTSTLEGRALQETGATLSKIGRQRQEADDAAYVTEAFNKASMDESIRFNDISTRGEDIDLENDRKSYNDRYQEALDSAPSANAKNSLKSQLDNLYNNKISPMNLKYQTGRNVEKRKNSYVTAQEAVNKDLLLGHTSFAEGIGRTEAILVGMESTLGGELDINATRRQYYNKLTATTLSERINRGEEQAVISEIKAGKWNTYADSSLLEKTLDTARRQLKSRQGQNKQAYLGGVNDYISFLSSGNDDPSMAARYNKETLIKMAGGDKGARLNEQIADARAFGQAVSLVKDATPEELQDMLSKAQPKSATNFNREAKQYNALVGAINKREAAKRDDPVDYVNKNTRLGQIANDELMDSLNSGDLKLMKQSVTKFNAVQRANQQNLGVPAQERRILSKQLAKEYAGRLNDFSNGGQNAIEQLNFLKEVYGTEFQTVRKELSATGQLKSGITVLANTKDKQDQIKIGEALSVGVKGYKEILPKESFKSIQEDVDGELEDFFNTTSDPVFFKEHKDAVSALAMKMLAEGSTDDEGDALESAYNAVLGDRYNFKKTYRVPTEFNFSNVKFGINNILDQLEEGEIDLLAPENDLGIPDDVAKEIVTMKRKATPRTTQDNRGIRFDDQYGDVILKADGTPLMITFEELEKEEPSFWESIFE